MTEMAVSTFPFGKNRTNGNIGHRMNTTERLIRFHKSNICAGFTASSTISD